MRSSAATWRRGGLVRLGKASRPNVRRLRTRQARWRLLDREDLRSEEQSSRIHLLDNHPAIREAQRLAEDFGQLVRQRDRSALDPWLARAKASTLPEYRAFAVGVFRDRSAVEAALTLEWSNGTTEGHINRLKYLKRQMFGRAGFALLRQRVLRAG